jgi:hypothetical protein
MATKQYPFAVWATQGGGLVKMVDDQLIFVEEAPGTGLGVGDVMPREWDTIPANEWAREIDRQEFGT